MRLDSHCEPMPCVPDFLLGLVGVEDSRGKKDRFGDECVMVLTEGGEIERSGVGDLGGSGAVND